MFCPSTALWGRLNLRADRRKSRAWCEYSVRYWRYPRNTQKGEWPASHSGYPKGKTTSHYCNPGYRALADVTPSHCWYLWHPGWWQGCLKSLWHGRRAAPQGSKTAISKSCSEGETFALCTQAQALDTRGLKVDYMNWQVLRHQQKTCLLQTHRERIPTACVCSIASMCPEHLPLHHEPPGVVGLHLLCLVPSNILVPIVTTRRTCFALILFGYPS